LEWLEVRLNVGCGKRLVYEYRIEPLKCDRDALKQECRLERIACSGTQLPTYLSEKIQRARSYCPQSAIGTKRKLWGRQDHLFYYYAGNRSGELSGGQRNADFYAFSNSWKSGKASCALTWNDDMINSCWNRVRSTFHISSHRYSIVRRRLHSVLPDTTAHSLH